MNRHFEDTLYYLKRAGKTASKGVQEELAPVESKVRGITGREREPEPGRVEAIRADLKSVQAKAEGEAKEAIGEARAAIGQYRGRKVEQ
ncbi:MAG: hypothetical protein ABEJ26_00075 [Halosimplex sp.]